MLVAGVVHAFDEPDGFRGIKWGTAISECPDMVRQAELKDTILYHRANDKMVIGDAVVDQVLYGFYKGRFYYANINFSNLVNFKGVKDTLFQAYGDGAQSNPYIDKYVWLGNSVKMILSYSVGKGNIGMFYWPIVQEKNAADKEAARKGKSDL
jgi:hypothetical protein